MRAWYTLTYVLWIIGEIVKGSFAVAGGVYSPRTRSSPAIVEYPLRAATDLEIIAMASSITITPGTLVVGTAHGTLEEGPSLFVHVLFAESREQVVADLATWFAADPEARVDADLRPDLAAAQDDSARLRVVVDQVASLTDVRALALHGAHCD